VGRDNQYYQYLRAFSAGCQEFIEAYVYYNFLLGKELPDWSEVNEKLQYKSENDEEFSLEIVPTEFMLGLADFTGEIMRYSINSLGSGDTEICYQVCRKLQDIYARFMTISYIYKGYRDFSNKTSTMRSSMLKCEEVCYNLKVRGTEGSKLVQLDALQRDDHDVDEGIY
jgi:predicted translin family RNA/ssDNA-binding protein